MKKNKENKYVIELNEEEIEIMINLAMNNIISPSREPEIFCQKSKDLSSQIPERIKNILTNFVIHGSETGFLLIKKIPLDETMLPKTPQDNILKIGEHTILARIQSIFISFIGHIISYEAEGYGRLFQDVVPLESMSENQTSLGSEIELEIHTEQAFSELRPDFLSLACLRGDEKAFTYILPIEYILENLTSEEIQLLHKPLWKTGVDLSFKLNGHAFIHGDVRGPLAIIQGTEKKPQLIFDQDLMTGITEESEKLKHKIIDIYYKKRIRHNLQSGEIVLIDNRRAVHGRSSFFPKYDGYDRFLIRCFAILDYEKTNYARIDNSRTIAAIYS